MTNKPELQEKTEFLAHISHEIRTPLSAVLGMIAIGLKANDIRRKDHCLERAERSAMQLLGILDDIFDMSNIETDRFFLTPVDFDLDKCIKTIVSAISAKTDEKGQQFVVDLDSKLPHHVVGDELRLSQVIKNLLSNAIRFTPEKGIVTLSVSVTDEQEHDTGLRVEVTDTGIGLSKELQERLFTTFGQTDPSVTSHFGGVGLGLAISKRIVELMGGSLWVESEPGKGAAFIFTVRVGKPESLAGFSLPKRNTDSYDFEKYTILAAEDIEINREIISGLLEGTGISIDFACNGKDALDMFKADPERYAMILMDIIMPEMDGYETTEAIRALDLDRAREIPIIAMTANVFREDIEKCLDTGMDDHIGKPIDLDLLLKKIDRYVRL